MKILLTGASGMVGKNIMEHSLTSVYSILTPSSRELNLLDFSAVEDYISSNHPDIIIHAAGLVGGIQANIKDPVGFLTSNLVMGLNVIKAARKHNVKKLLNLGSSCMYPKNIDTSISENMMLDGPLENTNEGYALAKIVCAKLCEYISIDNSNYQYKTIIPCNLYGRHDKFGDTNSHMIPAVIKKTHNAIIENKSIIDIWGDGESRREFMNAADLADFIFYAIENFVRMPNYINVGIGYDYSINEYYHAVAKVIGYKGEFKHDLNKPIGMKRKLVDVGLLSKFGWKHKISLDDGIKQTYEYYLEHKIND